MLRSVSPTAVAAWSVNESVHSEKPLRRLRGAIEVLQKFQEVEDIPDHERDAIALVADGIDLSVAELSQIDEELHKASGAGGRDNEPTPLHSA